MRHAPRDLLREAIKLGLQMAESEARRMLALKTQRALANTRQPLQSAPRPPYRPDMVPTVEAPSIAPKP